METATDDQRNIMFDLVDLVEKEKELCKKIDKIFSSIKSGVHYSGGAISVCEDEDDALIISIKPRNELKLVRNQIGVLMQKAIDLGMGDVGIIERNSDYYINERWND